MKGADLAGADLGADMRNQSMGLMRGVLRSADLEGVDFTGANLAHADFEFARLAGADFTGANAMSAAFGGADLTGSTMSGARFDKADMTSAILKALVGADTSTLEKANNLERAFRD